MGYSRRFNRDYKFYLKNLNVYSFCGKANFTDKDGNKLVIFDVNGDSAKHSFFCWESHGEIIKTREPELLLSLHKCKASINLHITLWSEGRASGDFPGIEFDEYCKINNMPKWVIKSVENQKIKIMSKLLEKYLFKFNLGNIRLNTV